MATAIYRGALQDQTTSSCQTPVDVPKRVRILAKRSADGDGSGGVATVDLPSAALSWSMAERLSAEETEDRQDAVAVGEVPTAPMDLSQSPILPGCGLGGVAVGAALEAPAPSVLPPNRACFSPVTVSLRSPGRGWLCRSTHGSAPICSNMSFTAFLLASAVCSPSFCNSK